MTCTHSYSMMTGFMSYCLYRVQLYAVIASQQLRQNNIVRFG